MSAETSSLIVKGIFYLDGEQVSISIRNGKIAEIDRTPQGDNPKMYVVSGLVDIQINGYMGVDFAGPDLTLYGLRKATRELWAKGITTFLPTVITNSHDRLIKSFTVLAQVLIDSEIRNSIPRFHLEGPYISPIKGYRGAHLKKYKGFPH